LVPQHFVSLDGTECNKVGVGHTAFRNQGNKCEALPQSCLGGQLRHFRESDSPKESQGEAGEYKLKYHTMGGGILANVKASEPEVTFTTDRFQKTLLSLSFAADAVRFTQKM
jgi:hypothetical protein